jgi:hypothetical protein
VYEIIEVPAETPDTKPVASTVALAVFVLLHTPPNVASFRLVVCPEHIVAVPVIATGVVVTVITWVA